MLGWRNNEVEQIIEKSGGLLQCGEHKKALKCLRKAQEAAGENSDNIERIDSDIENCLKNL